MNGACMEVVWVSIVPAMHRGPSQVAQHATALLEPEHLMRVRSFGIASGPVEFEKLSNGNRLYRRDPIFKVGTFKDSMGMANTWEATHLSQMVFNFGMLRDAGKLTTVPWRNGHPSIFGGGGEVIGWIRGLTFEDDVLWAEWECTEPWAAEAYDRGTFGPRSAEVGFYESNDEAMYWPVVVGCAFVDIPAVEGLFTKEMSMERLNQFAVLPDKEVATRVALFNGQQSAQNAGNGGGNGGDNGGEGGAGGQTPEQQPAQQQQPDPNTPSQPTAEHGRASQAHTFMVNGQPTHDFGAVQQHISVLEATLREQTEQARREFVAGLASRNVILAPMVESTTNFALSLTPEQYEAWRATFPDQQQPPPVQNGQNGQHAQNPQNPLFGAYGDVSNPNGQQAQAPTEVETNREIVLQHKRSGMPVGKIKTLPSYKALEAAGQAPTL